MSDQVDPLKSVFRPSACPHCRKSDLLYDDSRGIASCPSCSSMWVTEQKPKTNYRALTYQIASGGMPAS